MLICLATAGTCCLRAIDATFETPLHFICLYLFTYIYINVVHVSSYPNCFYNNCTNYQSEREDVSIDVVRTMLRHIMIS